jgi:hypothetical protein
MKTLTKAWGLTIAIVASLPGPTRAVEDVALLKDMTSVVALLGLPCGQVVGVVTKGENDHLVACKDGNRYRIVLNAEGRVVAQKQ